MALDELIRKANNGDVGAMEELGREYAIKGNFGQSIEWNQKAASKGSGAAMMALSSLYRNGSGVSVNLNEANKWLKAAADAGHGAAMFSLFIKYEKGENGFEKNPTLAFKYVEKMSTTKGWETFGRLQLADYYLQGFGTIQDINKGYSILESLANEGYGDAQYKLAYYYATGQYWAQDLDLAGDWGSLALNSTKKAGLTDIEKIHSMAYKLLNTEFEVQNNGNPNARGCLGCYVATAVYGSYDCPQVWVLRRFRDYCLAKTWYGRAFIRTYYAISPTLVKWFGDTRWFNNMWKPKFDYMVTALKKRGYEDTPYND